MIIEDMNQVKELLNNMQYYFMNIDDTGRKLAAELTTKELERNDLLHEIEISKLNAIEIMAVYKRLENVLKERRKIKDKIDLINTMRSYANKYIEKGICGETATIIKNIETLKSNQENRQYTPRILKVLFQDIKTGGKCTMKP